MISSANYCLFNIIVCLIKAVLELEPLTISVRYVHLGEVMEDLLSLHLLAQLDLIEIGEVISDMFLFITVLACFRQVIYLHLLKGLAQFIKETIHKLLPHI